MTYEQGAAARAAWHRGKLHARRGLSDIQVTELRSRAAEGPAALCGAREIAMLILIGAALWFLWLCVSPLPNRAEKRPLRTWAELAADLRAIKDMP